jgi:hypothetical protein
VTLDRADVLNLGSYMITIEASYFVDVTASFNVQIIASCELTTFETEPNPVQPMMIQLGLSGSLTQKIKVWTALERVFSSIICPITAFIRPTQNHVVVSADFKYILVNETSLIEALPDSLGTFTYTLIINSIEYPKEVPEA